MASIGFRPEAKQRLSTTSGEGCGGFALEVVGLPQQRREFRSRADSMEPRVAHHSRIAEKSVLDGARQRFQRPILLAKATELPCKLVDSFGIAERGFAQLLAGLQALFSIAFEQRSQGDHVKPAETPNDFFAPAQLGDGFLGAAQGGEHHALGIAEIAAGRIQGFLVVAEHEVGVIDCGEDGRIEPVSLLLRAKRRLQQAAAAADVAEAGKKLGVTAAAAAVQEALQCVERAALIHLELRVSVVRHGEIGIQAKRGLKRSVSRPQCLLRAGLVLVDEPPGAAQAGPRRSIPGIARQRTMRNVSHGGNGGRA